MRHPIADTQTGGLRFRQFCGYREGWQVNVKWKA
jgi:hypothetical protein